MTGEFKELLLVLLSILILVVSKTGRLTEFSDGVRERVPAWLPSLGVVTVKPGSEVKSLDFRLVRPSQFNRIL